MPTKIKLKDDQSAIVLSDSAGVELFIESGDEEEDASQSAMFITLLAVLIKQEDEDFKKLIEDKMYEYIYSKLEAQDDS